jgi:hypothetical protein
MKRRGVALRRACSQLLAGAAVLVCVAGSYAQENAYERTFPQSKATIEKILKELQPAAGGRLPVLDGFATSPDHPLERYQRGYYQAKFQVSAAPSGGSIVRVSVQVTAWYADPVAAKSGYQLLTSNGRLEGDLLDQLSDQLATAAPHPSPSAPATAVTTKPPKPYASNTTASKPTDSNPVASNPAASNPSASNPTASTAAPEPAISAPMPRLPDPGNYSSSAAQGEVEPEKAGTPSGAKPLADKDGGPLQTEVNSLEEILKNQAHPKNLVAVKKSGTPIVASASLTAKTLFLASAHDEFEMLDFTRDWVHVRISGLSRGWIWRNNLEMPDSVPDTDTPPNPDAAPSAAQLFHISREESAPFPGDWAPLRGKYVKIVSVEKIDENAKDAGPQLRLEFAKSILEKDYAELAQKSQELFGIVVIFDSVDGGMIAATFPTLQQWKAGKLSDAALWHQCFFDPPEISGAPSASPSE